jgi:hypothetical protein
MGDSLAVRTVFRNRGGSGIERRSGYHVDLSSRGTRWPLPWRKGDGPGRSNARGVVTCCRRTLMRRPWRPGNVRAGPLIQPRSGGGDASDGLAQWNGRSFVAQAMHIGGADIRAWVAQANGRCTRAACEMRDQTAGETTRSPRWFGVWQCVSPQAAGCILRVYAAERRGSGGGCAGDAEK